MILDGVNFSLEGDAATFAKGREDDDEDEEEGEGTGLVFLDVDADDEAAGGGGGGNREVRVDVVVDDAVISGADDDVG